ncbi:MAG: hypoxanthine phosphoribosyltransferase [Chloroflexi bacterium OLB15]|nr:MAG: hypoxanthine phosphoribosyltransferase [Chloroflexi bacterium OLB15]
MDVQEATRRAIRRHNLVALGANLVVAVSGGTDSMALLHALAALRDQKTLKVQITAASLDHGLRGAEGAADAAYVLEQCERWQVPCVTGSADTLALVSSRKLGIEEAARFARYRFLAKVAQDTGADRIATAHHADDQAETVLMRLLRGTGVAGLAGMGYEAPMPYTPEYTVIRPLLNVTRRQIEAYASAQGIAPRHDASNDDQAYTRNYLRQSLLPEIETRFPGAARALAQLAESAAVDNAFIEAMLEVQTAAHTRRLSGKITISRQHFRALDLALQRRFLRKTIRELGMNEEIGHEHILAAVEVLATAETGAIIEFPGGLSARLEREEITIIRRVDG